MSEIMKKNGKKIMGKLVIVLARVCESFFAKKNVTLPLAQCLSVFRRWHYGGISGIFDDNPPALDHYVKVLQLPF